MKNLAVVDNKAGSTPVAPDNEAFLKLANLIDSVDWAMKITLVQNNAGLPMGKILMDAKMTVGVGSMAKDLGHLTIHDFVSQPREKLGLGINWEEWEDLVAAMQLKSSLNVPSNSPEGVLHQVQRVAEFMGRQPINPEEFHRCREILLTQDFENAKEKYEKERQDRALEISKLNEQLQDSLERYSALSLKNRSLSEEFEETLASQQQSQELLKESLTKKAESELRATISLIKEEHLKEVEALRVDNSSAIKTIRKRFENQIMGLQSKGEEAQAKFSELEAEYRETIIGLRQDLASVREVSANDKASSRELDLKLSALESDLQSARDRIKIQLAEISEYKKDKESLEEQLESFIAENDGLMKDDFIKVKEDLEKVRSECAEKAEALEASEKARQESDLRARKYRASLNEVKKNAEEMADNLENSSTAFKEDVKDMKIQVIRQKRAILLLSLGLSCAMLSCIALAIY
jgi:hypothetical protein